MQTKRIYKQNIQPDTKKWAAHISSLDTKLKSAAADAQALIKIKHKYRASIQQRKNPLNTNVVDRLRITLHSDKVWDDLNTRIQLAISQFK